MMSESGSPIIEVRNLVARYGERTILDGVSFDVARGEIFVILGGSGSGKSTLMRHMIGLQRAHAGEIRVDGDIMDPDDAGVMEIVHRKIGMMFQNGALFSSMTIAENIALPLQEHTDLDRDTRRSLATMKLNMVNLAGSEDLYPSELSGGMRKRAAIARAMALDPEILFFDEPSAGLDPITAVELDGLILRLNETLGTTIVIITHELSSINALAGRGVLLSESKALAVGTLEEIRRDGGAVARRFFERTVERTGPGRLDALGGLIEDEDGAVSPAPSGAHSK